MLVLLTALSALGAMVDAFINPRKIQFLEEEAEGEKGAAKHVARAGCRLRRRGNLREDCVRLKKRPYFSP